MQLGPETTVWESPTKRTRVVEFGYTPEGGTEKPWVGLRMSKAVGILAVGKGMAITLVHQPRPVINDEHYLELPAGLIDAGEEPIDAAKRELEEEVGLLAESWSYLGSIRPSPGLIDEEIFLFLARDLQNVPDRQDETERIERVDYALGAVQSMIRDNTIKDPKIIVALALARIRVL